MIALAAERKNLPHKIPASYPCFKYLIKIVAYPDLFRHVVDGQLRVSDYDGKDIVEVVRDAAGQRAYSLHLLRLAKLLLNFCPLGHLSLKILTGLRDLGCPLPNPLLKLIRTLLGRLQETHSLHGRRDLVSHGLHERKLVVGKGEP